MIFFEAKEQANLAEAAKMLKTLAPKFLGAGELNFCLKCQFKNFAEDQFFSSVSGVYKVYFKSRDQDLEVFGLGAADLQDRSLACVSERRKSLIDSQIYFSALRFDDEAIISHEWAEFGDKLFILPLLLVTRINNQYYLLLNYRNDSHLPTGVWLDHALSILSAQNNLWQAQYCLPKFEIGSSKPEKIIYKKIVKQALSNFSQDHTRKKVVIARLNTVHMQGDYDPYKLFIKLRKNVHNGFAFFIACPNQSAFFGVSPELLYSRQKNLLKTESLAGTNSISLDIKEDAKLKDALLNSAKDQYEHEFVSQHIIEKLSKFLHGEILSSNLSVVNAGFVRHLRREYQALINSDISDSEIIQSLHPTPATCGFTQNWAREFIRKNEGFDRGFYAGPLGILGLDMAEFCVAIRSALFFERKLFIYAGGGLVFGSDPELEWEEINNKQKSLMTIFGGIN